MQTLEELLNIERENPPEYRDERIASTLYCCSLPKPMRSMDAMASLPDMYKKCVEESKWLFSTDEDEAPNTPVISLDMVTQKIAPGMRSVDAMFYNAEDSRAYSYLLEFKNIGRAQMISMLVPSDEKDKDSVLEKIRDSRLLLRSKLELTGGCTGDELLHHTIVILVYNHKDMPSKMDNPFVMHSAAKPERGHHLMPSRRKQERRFSFVKSLEEREIKFRTQLEKLGMGKISKNDWPMRIKDPKVPSEGTCYILMTAAEFRDLVSEKKIFTDWQWGGL